MGERDFFYDRVIRIASCEVTITKHKPQTGKLLLLFHIKPFPEEGKCFKSDDLAITVFKEVVEPPSFEFVALGEWTSPYRIEFHEKSYRGFLEFSCFAKGFGTPFRTYRDYHGNRPSDLASRGIWKRQK